MNASITIRWVLFIIPIAMLSGCSQPDVGNRSPAISEEHRQTRLDGTFALAPTFNPRSDRDWEPRRLAEQSVLQRLNEGVAKVQRLAFWSIFGGAFLCVALMWCVGAALQWLFAPSAGSTKGHFQSSTSMASTSIMVRRMI
jgi:hypothetical protein